MKRVQFGKKVWFNCIQLNMFPFNKVPIKPRKFLFYRIYLIPSFCSNSDKLSFPVLKKTIFHIERFEITEFKMILPCNEGPPRLTTFSTRVLA